MESPSVPYFTLPRRAGEPLEVDAALLLRKTPLPKGSTSFSSVHIVAASHSQAQVAAHKLERSVLALGKEVCTHMWPAVSASDIVGEYQAFFRVSSELILKGADRSSLVVFMAGTGEPEEFAAAALLGMLPFRGVQVAFVSPGKDYVDPLRVLSTASGLFEYSAMQPGRMGRRPLAAIFGPLPERTFSGELEPWSPLQPEPAPEEKPAPFKIGGLSLPMVTYEGHCAEGVQRLAALLTGHFGDSMFPVVAVGQTVDALGYGADILSALRARGCGGYYFAHPSGESQKRPEAFGAAELLSALLEAKRDGRRVVIIAVGGGVNGNAMGTIAAMIGSDFVEVPTTLMHYNDATTSAKKAFSLVVDGQILSKNILGAFYLPSLVFCISETFLTLSPCSVHAAVGESAKTMCMLGDAKSAAGQQEFHNILGAVEFASDFTRVVGTVGGFERLVLFLQATAGLKACALSAGRALRIAREAGAPPEELRHLEEQRGAELQALRSEFHGGVEASAREEIMAFLTVINEEVIRAKAMFLSYSDPFEKYRALLFEYAHTLGHGVEAFMNDLYRHAESLGIDTQDAFRLHGQCVGMAVLWAGEMSMTMGHLEGDGYLAHQALIYLFNRFGGFDFAPLRALCDELGVSRSEFCEGVLRVVRRDNKRGYCHCAPDSSVDQLVQRRPGCLLRSSDPSAELRYLVEVSEDSQRDVLERAFDGAYDRVLELESGELALVPRAAVQDKSPGEGAGRKASALRQLLRRMYEEEEEEAEAEAWAAPRG